MKTQYEYLRDYIIHVIKYNLENKKKVIKKDNPKKVKLFQK